MNYAEEKGFQMLEAAQERDEVRLIKVMFRRHPAVVAEADRALRYWGWWVSGGRMYHPKHPRILFHRLSHVTPIGALRGCTCSKCFNSTHYRMRGQHVIDRFVRGEKRIERLEREHRNLIRRVRALENPNA